MVFVVVRPNRVGMASWIDASFTPVSGASLLVNL